VETTHVPTRGEMARRASELVPLLRANAAWTEQNRRLHPESIEALADAGIFRMRVPARYGGYESDTQTLVDVGTELGRGDGSTSWVASVYWIPGWMVGLFPDEVQDEVFATPDVRVCGTLSPSGMAKPRDGGIVVTGRWGFISGALHAHWQEIIAILVPEDGEPYPVMALVPISDLEIVDDWHVGGLRGTGSVTTVATELYVPKERVLPLPAVLTERYASVRNAEVPMYRAPLIGAASASAVGTPLGLAKAVQELFFERMPNRKLTYTNYESQREAPVTHLRVADASLKIDQAEFHARRLAGLVDRKGATGEPWTLEERIRGRADVGSVCLLTKAAVDILATASGGSSIYDTSPIQRINRDIQAINLHALMAPDATHELYGRLICGLEPNTPYV
jgi:alkylation response protein AidB-like acyl-CoA dehydrogenase